MKNYLELLIFFQGKKKQINKGILAEGGGEFEKLFLNGFNWSL